MQTRNLRQTLQSLQLLGFLQRIAAPCRSPKKRFESAEGNLVGFPPNVRTIENAMPWAAGRPRQCGDMRNLAKETGKASLVNC